MSTIALRFGVRTRNWPRIDFQPSEFNFESYFWRFRGGGLLSSEERVRIVDLYIKLKTCLRLQK